MAEESEKEANFNQQKLELCHKALRALIYFGLAFIAFLIIYILFNTSANGPSIFAITIAAGGLGAIFSNTIRLHQINDLSQVFEKEVRAAEKSSMISYAAVTSVVGVVASGVVYMIFAARFIQGAPFPAFVCGLEKPEDCDSILSLINDWGPSLAEDYAKLILWGFIVGFSERLIPDLLGQYSKMMDQKVQAAAVQQLAGDITALQEAKAAFKAAEVAVAKADNLAKVSAAQEAAAKAKAEAGTATEEDKKAADEAKDAAAKASSALAQAKAELTSRKQAFETLSTRFLSS